ncbi:MAG: metal-dependent hydrolase [Chloroflexota bacterium]|nr:metal-dependent hydrolase [Chloroflexota bacterium]
MMGRSHVLRAGAGYAALAARPLETPFGTLVAPVLGGGPIPEGEDAFALSLAIAASCGLAPDIDKTGSTAARSLGIITRVLSWGIERSLGHRGGLHSLAGAALGYFLGDLLGGLLGLTGLGALIVFGWAAHLLTDAWTVRGVPLFWPLSTGRVTLPPWISTGGRMEAVMLVIALCGLFLYAIGGPLQAGAT